MKAITTLSHRILVLAVGLVVIGFLSGQANAQDIRVEFMASDTSWIESAYTGHAFMCIRLRINSGWKEDCYGFYPKSGSKGFIGGPGLVQSEFQKNPSRFARIGISISKPINESQRLEILRLVNVWNGEPFDLTNRNCIDFVASVAKDIGWLLPAREPTELPRAYLKKLQDENALRPSIPGSWAGSITTNNGNFDISLIFLLENGNLKGSITIQSEDKANCDNLQISLDRAVSFSAGSGVHKMTFTGRLEEGLKSMGGTFTSSLGNGRWSVRKQ